MNIDRYKNRQKCMFFYKSIIEFQSNKTRPLS